ncbi:hypothetical protein GC098_27235 [Paenibacillus sp. LMG 31458]|uniref:SLH domain-containing protein n=1 Tax=Paenibacillus phytorum TaxID=2654977 RepID=A0ABX1Y474_9BACL|nr:S-layer homology domain-containing protein [Paenibacillus phytorum]NOU75036.1 hypothetical protein [Paenibacillus phytorum]
MKKWEVVQGTVDAAKGEVTVDVNRLGKYALFNTSNQVRFDDIPKNRWSAAGIYALQSLGVVDGISSGNGNTAASAKPFADAADIPYFARGYADQVRQAGLLNGYEDGTFRPGNSLTREETAALIYRLIQHFDR